MKRNLIRNVRPKNKNYRGVHQCGDSFTSRIAMNGEDYYLGVFHTEEEAAIAYNKKAKELYGNLASLNKVN